jgi:enhancing lycopene biosynthesis protein 2
MQKQKKIAVVLSGCGHIDGAEITESVLTLLYLDRHLSGYKVEIFAPDINQSHVVDHQTGQEVKNETRNVLKEAARIARGRITSLDQLKVDEFSALVMPGGFGAAKNLSDIAINNNDPKVLPSLAEIIKKFYQQEKPIAAICIAPAVLALALKGLAKDLLVTLGDESGEPMIKKFGASYQTAITELPVVDQKNKVVTVSAYMRDDKISNIAYGIESLVIALKNLWLNH